MDKKAIQAQQHKREKVNAWYGRGVRLVDDIVTDNIYFPDSNLADHWKVLRLFDSLVPFKDGMLNGKPTDPVRESWMAVECIRSNKTPGLVGTKMEVKTGSWRKVGGRRTVEDFVDGKDAEIVRLRKALTRTFERMQAINDFHGDEVEIYEEIAAALDAPIDMRG